MNSCRLCLLVPAIARVGHRVMVATKLKVDNSFFASPVLFDLCPHAGRAHTFLKLKKYAKKFCRKAPASSAMQSGS